MNKEDLYLILSITSAVSIIIFCIWISLAWYSLPCKELKTHWLLKNGSAPIRCIGE